MRKSIEKVKNQEIDDIKRLEEKIKDIHNTIDPLPNQVEVCESMCKTSEETSVQMKTIMKRIQTTNIKLETEKASVEAFESFKERMEERLLEMENGFDKTRDRCNSLENWIDIYMPLRLQH